MSTATANANSTPTNNTVNIEQTVRNTVNYPHNREDQVKRTAVVLTVIAEGFKRSKAEQLVPDKEWFDVQPPDSTDEDGEDTEDFSNTEPLDPNTDDIYSLQEPISNTADGIKDRYLTDDGNPVTAIEAKGRYWGKRDGENTLADDDGLTNNAHKRSNRRFYLLSEGDRRLVRRWIDDDLTTALISLRLSQSDCDRRVDQLREATDAFDKVIRKLRYDLRDSANGPQLDSEQFTYAYAYAGTDDYATVHIHLVVYINERVSRDTFSGVVEKWVDKCDYAPADGRGNRLDGGTVSVKHRENIPLTDDGRTAAMKYVSKQIPHIAPLSDLKGVTDTLLFYSTMDAYDHTGVGWANNWPITMGEVKSKFDIF
jgi:hypothetical protein